MRHKKPFPDQRFSFMFGQVFKGGEDRKLALTGALNYSNTGKSYIGMENSRFGVYNKVKDEPIYQYKYTDNQYTRNARLGAMLNLAFTGEIKAVFISGIFLTNWEVTDIPNVVVGRISALYIFRKKQNIFMAAEVPIVGNFRESTICRQGHWIGIWVIRMQIKTSRTGGLSSVSKTIS